MDVREKLSANTRIASALLEVLGSSGEIATRARALRAAGGEGGSLRIEGGWIAEETLCKMVRCVPVEPGLARRVGQALVSPSGWGLALCYSGVATVEKAFRRADQLLARETPDGRYEVVDLSGSGALIQYHHGTGEALDPVFCTIREGMLQGLPLAFGLLPARVREVECVHKGEAAQCAFDVRWTRSSRRGLGVGMLAGGLAGVGVALGLVPLLASSVAASWPAAVAAAVLLVLGAALGHSVDLSRQLAAVAGARRGQLALLDQADRSLADRMDDLAKLESGVEGASEGSWPRSSERASGVVVGGEVDDRDKPTAVMARAAEGLHRELDELQRALREQGGSAAETSNSSAERGSSESAPSFQQPVQNIQAIAAELALRADPEGHRRWRSDLGEIVRRVADHSGPCLGESQTLSLDLDPDLPRIECEPFQIERVVTLLVRNALDAIGDSGRIALGLRSAPRGVEISIEDDGGGMREGALDEAFDPFLTSDADRNEAEEAGLAQCYRVVDEHGGELQVASEAERGTRVTIHLPCSPSESDRSD